MSRLEYSIKNARVALLFNLAILVLGFISRRVWYDTLGNDMVGLTEAVRGYIGFLNLADLGITAAIAAVLYVPLFNQDRTKITEIVSIYGFLFRCVGIVVAVGGVILSLFLPLLFAGDGVDMLWVFMAFYAFLTTTVLSYVVNYKQNLLIADQKNYVVIAIFNTATIVKVIVQIVLLKRFGYGYGVWLALEVVTAVIFAVILESKIRKEYPWLRSNIREGRNYLKKYPEITRNIKQLFVHKITSFVTQQSQRIIIQLSMGLSMVGFYGSYMMISENLTRLIVGTLTSNAGGVGNLVAEGDKGKIKLVFWQMNAMFFWIGGVVAFGFYHFITPLIRLWIPVTELFSDWVVLIMAFNLFVYIVRQSVGYFVNAYGIFSDTPAAWIEAILNLSLSIILGIEFGIIGVVAGSAVSSLVIVMLWRPHYLYYKGFKERSGAEYWVTSLKYFALLVAVWIGVSYLNDTIFPSETSTWTELVINTLVITPIIGIAYGAALWLTSQGMRDFVRLMWGLLQKRFR